MSKYLLDVTENYRVDTENEAIKLIDEARKDRRFVLKKHTSTYKERKQKGEVVDAWWKVVLTKTFTDEKEPMGSAEVEYNNGSAF